MATLDQPLARYEPLLASLMTAFAGSQGPRAKAALPGGRREELIDLLTQVVADPALFEAYTQKLRAVRRAYGLPTELRLLGASESQVPWEQVAAGGFGSLPDDVLADLATSPEALEAFDEMYVQSGDQLGGWFFDAVARYAPPLEPARSAAAAHIPSAATPSERQRPASTRRHLRWVVPAGLAAGLLLGGLIGWGLREGGKQGSSAVAHATIAKSVPRGAGEPVTTEVTVHSPTAGFVTVIELFPDKKQLVTDPGTDFDPIAAGGSRTVLLKEADAAVVVFVVTETPAGEVIRMRLGDQTPHTYKAAEAEQFARDLETLLRGTGFNRYAIGRELIPAGR